MFTDDYKNDLENIKPDGYIKYKIRRRLSGEEKAFKKPPKKVYFGRAVAAVLSLVLVFTAGAVIGRLTSPITPVNQTASILKTAENYDKIYSALAEFRPTILDSVKDFVTFGSDKATNDIADSEGLVEESFNTNTNSGNASAKPNDGAASPDADGVTADDSEGSLSNKEDHSETTTQVDGVDEADIVKTDGKYIYILSSYGKNGIKIVKAGENPTQLSAIDIKDENIYANDLYLTGDRLVVLGGKTDGDEVVALIYDISNPNEPKKLISCTQSGSIETSRLIGNKLYIVSNLYVDVNNMVKSNTQSYMPYISCDDTEGAVPADTVHFYNQCQSPEFTVISAFNIENSSLISTQSVLGGTRTVYSSTDNIITADRGYSGKTQIARFKIQDGIIELKASAELSGSLLNQFSIDEYNDHFRFVLTENKEIAEEGVTSNGAFVSSSSFSTVNSLVILDADLKETGKITDLAEGETVYSVRFMGDKAYFVTFRQTDPLFSVDVSNPAAPRVLGALKIPGFSNYLFPYGNGKLLGIGQDADENTGRTTGMKLSMFDISDPSNVTEQDKTLIPAVYSEALYNHKAVLADYNRNIIAFAGNGTYTASCFFVYSYENGQFVKKLEAEVQNTSLCRGLYIGNTLYVVTEYRIDYFDMTSFRKIGSLTLG